MADETVRKARDEQKKRAAAMAGYASTIATGGLGLTGQASTTSTSSSPSAFGGGKTLLGA